jgi:hypothetical protein
MSNLHAANPDHALARATRTRSSPFDNDTPMGIKAPLS